MVTSFVTAKDRKQAIKKGQVIAAGVYSNKFIVSDVVFVKGSKRKNFKGRTVKRFGVVLRKRKR